VADTRIVELMAVPANSRDISWLQESLQAALELELSTLPVYLCGMWSIKNQSGEVYELINSVVLEEMLHLGFACNILTALGGTPKIVAPVYPGHLPGGVLPKLDVYLSELTATSLEMYLAIEEPEHPRTPAQTDDPTIGMFYDAIAAVFQALSPPISPDGQLAATLSVPNPDGASTRITEPLTPVPFPDCYPVARVPQGGYPELPASKNFNTAYSQLLAHLQDAWTGGGQNALSAAIGTMFQLYPLAAPIIATPLPDGSGNYGPDFIPG
jgi:Ferritin-like